MKSKKAKTGDLIKIPFREDMWTYARIWAEGSYAFYDCSFTTERTDYEEIIKCDILFTAKVEVFAVKQGYWSIVANIPLESGLSGFYPRYFNPSPFNQINLNFYEVYKDEIEDAIAKDWIKTGKIQLDGIYGRVHIDLRLNDYYDGKQNKWNKMYIDIFKRCAGIPY